MTEFIPINIAVLTISDSRTKDTDKSGAFLATSIEEAGHQVADASIVPDDIYLIRAAVSKWIADPNINAILATGGTGVTGRDGTPEALEPLLDKTIQGFGEMFRTLSFEEIRTSTIQSRCLAGVANATYIFAMPGSTNACRLGWNEIIRHQLDSRTRPCNLVQLMPRLKEKL